MSRNDLQAQSDNTNVVVLWHENEFNELVTQMVNERAPRLFAVVQELGSNIDARIAAWGMAFEDGAEILSADGGLRMSLIDPEEAIRQFSRPAHVTSHLIWVN